MRIAQINKWITLAIWCSSYSLKQLPLGIIRFVIFSSLVILVVAFFVLIRQQGSLADQCLGDSTTASFTSSRRCGYQLRHRSCWTVALLLSRRRGDYFFQHFRVLVYLWAWLVELTRVATHQHQVSFHIRQSIVRTFLYLSRDCFQVYWCLDYLVVLRIELWKW